MLVGINGEVFYVGAVKYVFEKNLNLIAYPVKKNNGLSSDLLVVHFFSRLQLHHQTHLQEKLY